MVAFRPGSESGIISLRPVVTNLYCVVCFHVLCPTAKKVIRPDSEDYRITDIERWTSGSGRGSGSQRRKSSPVDVSTVHTLTKELESS